LNTKFGLASGVLENMGESGRYSGSLTPRHSLSTWQGGPRIGSRLILGPVLPQTTGSLFHQNFLHWHLLDCHDLV